MSAIGVVILAAGASTRMGTPKQLLLHQGRSLLRYTIDIVMASTCCPIAVVLGAYAEQIRLEVDPPVHAVINPNWAEGMGSSIGVGIETLIDVSPDLEAAIILLCDQPFISIQLIHQLIEAYHTTGQPIVVSSYAGTLGVPALFHQRFFPDLLGLAAYQGAKHLIEKYLDETAGVPFSKGAIDIDTPEDYEQLQSGLESQ